MIIPKIIHQTWKDENIPSEWQTFSLTWKKFNPQWDYILWTNESSRLFVKEYYPDFLSVYDNYPFDIQRADAIRYLVLHHFGGLYVDLDMECLQPIEPLLTGKSFVVGLEPQQHASWQNIDKMICNAFMASIKNHALLVEIIHTMKYTKTTETLHNDVMATTGPLMLTDVIKIVGVSNIAILESHVVYPCTSVCRQLKSLYLNRQRNHPIRKKFVKNNSYAIHYWSNSWVRTLEGPLTNKDPDNVAGYTFFQGKDSRGYDIANYGRDVDKLRNECDKNDKAIGFNTTGYLKFYISPWYKWLQIPLSEKNEGLYIKNEKLKPWNFIKMLVLRNFYDIFDPGQGFRYKNK